MSAGSSSLPVFVDGRIQSADEPAVSALDEGFLLGLSVFETVLCEDGHVYFFDEHLERLRHGATELGIVWPPPHDVRLAIARLAAHVPEPRFAVRVTYSRGVEREPTLVATARRIAPLPPDGVRVAVSAYRLLADDPLGGLKSSNRLRYVLAREAAQADGAWEALLLNHEGDVAEGTISNVFAVIGDELVTPSLDRGGLGGIVRGRILTEFERAGPPPVVREARIEPTGLRHATEVFLTNTTGGVIPVREIFGLPGGPVVQAGAEGEVTALAAERLAAAEKRDKRASGNPDPGCG